MKTLIFRTEKNLKSRFNNEMITIFVKEGDIVDAMNHFDGSRAFGNFFHNDDERFYYANNDSQPLITDDEIANNCEQSISVDLYRLWTSKINNLSSAEIKAVIETGYDYLISETLEANGYLQEEFEVAKHFNELNYLLENFPRTKDGERLPEINYLQFYEVSETEPEDDFLEYKGKFYTQK